MPPHVSTARHDAGQGRDVQEVVGEREMLVEGIGQRLLRRDGVALRRERVLA